MAKPDKYERKLLALIQQTEDQKKEHDRLYGDTGLPTVNIILLTQKAVLNHYRQHKYDTSLMRIFDVFKKKPKPVDDTTFQHEPIDNQKKLT